MKLLTFHLEGPHTVKRIMKERKAEEICTAVEAGFVSRRKDPILKGEDIQRNPYYLHIRAIIALTIDDFDIQDF